MRFVYEDQGSSTFVIYPVAPTEEIDTMSLGMLTNNCIPGFAPTSFSQKDADKYIKYNVTGKVPASQIFRGPVNKKRLTGLLQGIVDAMMAAEEYMLDPNSIELDLEQIYMDPVTCETVLLCVPVFRDDSISVDLPMFLKNIVFNTQFDQTENTDHVARIFNCLGAGSKLVLEDMKTLLDQIQGNRAPVKVAAVKQPAAQPAVEQPAVQQPAVQQPAVQHIPAQHQGNPAGYGRQPAVVMPPSGGGQHDLAGKFGPGYDPTGANKPTAPADQADPTTKPMSTWYLLNHMSKENIAIYKAQQAQNKGKAEKSAHKEKSAKGPQKKGPKVGGGPVKRVQPGFAVPGAQTPPPTPAFDIPGQESASAKEQISAARELPPVTPVDHSPAQQPAKSINFGGTTILGAEPGGTTILPGAGPVPMPTLVRKATGERVVINKQTFTIGIESYVDYRITGNSAVSRSHAKIIVRGNEFLLVDTNSTNGTYVNGNKIKKNVEVRIENGNKIVFANEEFDFLVC